MERRWNLATLMGLALLFLASTTAAADTNPVQEQESIPGAVPGKKFCFSANVDVSLISQLELSQQPSSYQPKFYNIEVEGSNDLSHEEYCFDLWYDESGETSDALSFLSSINNGDGLQGVSLQLGTDIDFGGVNSDGNSCVASFMPIPYLRYGSFFGNGHTVKNLCYVVNGPSSGVGFFSEATDATFYNLKFENVYFKVNNDDPSYSVPVGVVTGSLGFTEYGSSFKDINLKDVKIVASRAGGLVGLTESGAPSIHNISGENIEIVATEGVIPSSVSSNTSVAGMGIYLGGLVGMADAGVYVENAGITGLDVHSDFDFYTKEEPPPCASSTAAVEERVGGLVGIAQGGPVAISNTYTSGNISIPSGALATNGKGKIGFLAGYAVLSDDEVYVFGNNYHYGESDALAKDLLGYVSVDGQSFDTDSWITVPTNSGFKPGGHNYRNAISGKINATSGLTPPSYLISVEDAVNYGGYLDPQYMNVDAFAINLNNRVENLERLDFYSSGSLTRWSRKNGLNNGMPVLANESLRPIYQIDFFAGSDYYENISDSDKEKWLDAGATETSDGLYISIVTDYTGKLSNSTWQAAAAQMGSGNYYWSYLDEQANRVTAFPIKKTTVFNSDMTLSLSEKVAVTVMHGFVEYTDGAEFYTPDQYASLLGAYTYFMGTPTKTISSDSTWNRVPYLASYDSEEEVYRYHGFHFATKSCRKDGDEEFCEYESIQTDGTGSLYVDALPYLSNGDTLYVIYDTEPLSTAGGNLYVSDLHGEGFDADIAYSQVKAVKPNGEVVMLGEPDYLQSSSADSRDVDLMLDNAFSWQGGGAASSVPYSPYLVADYPPDFWNNVTGLLGLIIVGKSSNDGETEPRMLMRYATSELTSNNLEHTFLKDTVKALESPMEIRAKMDEQIKSGNSLVYARYIWFDKDGVVDLTNLFAAVETLRQYENDYPIYVGLRPQVVDMEYRVTFNLGVESYDYGDYSPLFVGDMWINNKGVPDSTYTEETSTELLIHYYDWRLFRTDACYKGAWYADDPTGDYDESTDLSSIGDLEEKENFPFVENKDGSRSLTVHPYWEEGWNSLSSCYDVYWPKRSRQNQETGELEWNNSIVEDRSEGGNIVLQQVWNGVTLRHMSTSLDEGVTGIYIPYVDSVGFTFEVYADGYEGFELDGKIKLAWEDSDEDPIPLDEGDTVHVSGWYEGGMVFYANYTYKKFTIEFVTDKSGVSYGENSDSVGVYKLKDEEDSIDLPFWVYTADSCVESWTVHSKFEEQDGPIWEGDGGDWYPDCEDEPACMHDKPDNWARSFDVFNFALSEELDLQLGKRLERYPMYAVWVDAKTCVEELSYKQIKLTESEKGSVAFKELRKDSTGKIIGTQLHKFAKDGTMLLPYYVKGSDFVVQGLPDDGYVLDSLVMTVDGKKRVYHEGDTLSGTIVKATFAAYFAEDNQVPMEFAKMELRPSGNAVRLEVSTTEFRAGGAKLRVTLENDDGKTMVDTLLAESIVKTPYSGAWEYYPLAAGGYLLTATLIKGKDSVWLEQDFEIKAEIASVQDSGWHMVSLANVNMDSVVWEGEDAKFFWWDEAHPVGIIWQYQEFKKGSKVDPLVGYWYSSLSGRTLVTRKDAYVPKDPVVWQLDSLYSGWNLVANPYGWYVNLYGENAASSDDATEKPDVEFLSWIDSLGSYEPVKVVGPNEAVWVQVNGPRTWKLPAKPEFVGKVDENGETDVVKPLKKTVEVGAFGKNRWALRAVLSDAKGKRDGWNILGVSENAWNAEEPPAGMGDRVNLSIMDGRKVLAKSFKKAAGDSYEWTVSLDATGNRMGFLYFEGIRSLNAEGLKVFVTVDGKTTQMNEGDTLKVALGSMAKTATIRVAPSARVTVVQKLDGLRAFQAGNSLQVGFQVSESLAGAKAYVEILDMKGKVLSSASATAVSGSNSMTLQTPKSGLYMVRVRVGSKQAAGSIAVK